MDCSLLATSPVPSGLASSTMTISNEVILFEACWCFSTLTNIHTRMGSCPFSLYVGRMTDTDDICGLDFNAKLKDGLFSPLGTQFLDSPLSVMDRIRLLCYHLLCTAFSLASIINQPPRSSVRIGHHRHGHPHQLQHQSQACRLVAFHRTLVQLRHDGIGDALQLLLLMLVLFHGRLLVCIQPGKCFIDGLVKGVSCRRQAAWMQACHR